MLYSSTLQSPNICHRFDRGAQRTITRLTRRAVLDLVSCYNYNNTHPSQSLQPTMPYPTMKRNERDLISSFFHNDPTGRVSSSSGSEEPPSVNAQLQQGTSAASSSRAGSSSSKRGTYYVRCKLCEHRVEASQVPKCMHIYKGCASEQRDEVFTPEIVAIAKARVILFWDTRNEAKRKNLQKRKAAPSRKSPPTSRVSPSLDNSSRASKPVAPSIPPALPASPTPGHNSAITMNSSTVTARDIAAQVLSARFSYEVQLPKKMDQEHSKNIIAPRMHADGYWEMPTIIMT